MTTFLFVLLFVTLGLGTVIVAMRSGQRGPVLDPQQRGGRRAVYLLTLASVLLFAVAIPIAVGIAGGDRSERAKAVSLNAEEVRGRTLFSPACSQCHTLSASKAVGRVGPNLDVLRPPEKLVEDAILKGRYRGQGQMPDKLFEGRDARAVAKYVAKVAGR